MTTAAQFCEAHGYDMAVVQSYMVNLAVSDPAALLAVCQAYGVSAEWLGEIAGWPGEPVPVHLVAAYFSSFNLSIDVLPLPPEPTVVSVTGNTVTEGGSLVYSVTLSDAPDVPMHFDLGVGGTGSMGDLDLQAYSISNGVVTNGHEFIVPAGVNAFTVTLPTANDTSVESTETVVLQVGGVSGTGTINDNDTAPPPSGNSLMPEGLEGMLPLVQLNTSTGVLATASLRADILAQASEPDYWLLFNAQGYAGADDDILTNAETGWTIGDQPATDDTMESVFYGTLINALKAVDNDEMMQVGLFVQSHEQALDNGDPAAFDQLIDLLVDVFSDPAPVTSQFFTDAMIHDAIVEVGVELVGMVELEPSIFHGLLNWAS